MGWVSQFADCDSVALSCILVGFNHFLFQASTNLEPCCIIFLFLVHVPLFSLAYTTVPILAGSTSLRFLVANLHVWLYINDHY